jgi:hypothetical protein
LLIQKRDVVRTVSVQKVLNKIVHRIGMDPEVNPDENLGFAILSFMDERLRQAWEFADWAEMTDVAEVELSPDAPTRTINADNYDRVFGVYLQHPWDSFRPSCLPYRVTARGLEVYEASDNFYVEHRILRPRIEPSNDSLALLLPYAFESYLVEGCYADYLIDEGQNEKGDKAEERANERLLYEYSKQEIQEGRSASVKVKVRSRR